MRHFVLHADQDTLRKRIQDDSVVGASTFRSRYLIPYSDAFQAWLHDEAEVVDTTELTPSQAATEITLAIAIS